MFERPHRNLDEFPLESMDARAAPEGLVPRCRDPWPKGWSIPWRTSGRDEVSIVRDSEEFGLLSWEFCP